MSQGDKISVFSSVKCGGGGAYFMLLSGELVKISFLEHINWFYECYKLTNMLRVNIHNITLYNHTHNIWFKKISI